MITTNASIFSFNAKLSVSRLRDTQFPMTWLVKLILQKYPVKSYKGRSVILQNGGKLSYRRISGGFIRLGRARQCSQLNCQPEFTLKRLYYLDDANSFAMGPYWRGRTIESTAIRYTASVLSIPFPRHPCSHVVSFPFASSKIFSDGSFQEKQNLDVKCANGYGDFERIRNQMDTNGGINDRERISTIEFLEKMNFLPCACFLKKCLNQQSRVFSLAQHLADVKDDFRVGRKENILGKGNDNILESFIMKTYPISITRSIIISSFNWILFFCNSIIIDDIIFM